MDEKNVQVLGVSFDGVGANHAFAERYAFGFPLLSDTSRSVGIAYGACDDLHAASARRISYLIGPDGSIERAYEKVSSRTHPEEVLASL